MRYFTTIVAVFVSLGILSGCRVDYDQDSGTLKVLKSGTDQETTEGQWKYVQEGLAYAETNVQTGDEEYKNILLVKIDPKKYRFTIYENKEQASAKTIEEIHKDQQSLLTFNGQFFTEDFKPTGLLMSEGRELRGESGAHLLNGIVAIDNDGNIHLYQTPQTLNKEKYVFAIQNGPVLINRKEEIQIEEDTGDMASRTAIGIDKDNNLILIILKQSFLKFDNSVSLYQLAHLLKEKPVFQELGLHSVLNLDGGTSTGLMIDDKYYPEMEKVQNVVLVKER